LLAELAKHTGDGDGEENHGPLENEKTAITKNIEELDEQITQAQKNWIANQRALITQQGTHAKITAHADELRNRKSILEQKKMRLNNSVESHNREIRQL
jgi:chromosome segregation ATPase